MIVWQYPATMPIAKADWLAHILREGYGILIRAQRGTTHGQHCLQQTGHPGSIRMPHVDSDSILEGWWPVGHIETEVPLCGAELPLVKHEPSDSAPYKCWIDNRTVSLKIDFFATMFFHLAREEENRTDVLDEYGRFPATASDAYLRGYLDRPIVDEYVEVLWAFIKRIWPNAIRIRREGKLRYTCDVDVPFDPATRSLKEFILRFGADLLLRRRPAKALQRLKNRLCFSRERDQEDPNYTFPYLLEQLNGLETPAVFYFLSTLSSGKGEGWYRIDDPTIIETLHLLDSNGHEIGLHGSFGSHIHLEQYQRELDLLRTVCVRAGVSKPVIRNRQHYLRFDSHRTPDLLETSGIAYDSSGAFADVAGFRFGTAIPFPMWSWTKNRSLQLIQEPLICMEASLLSPKYMHLQHYPEAYDYAARLKQRALAYGGDFTLLWHNSYLTTYNDRQLLQDLLQTASRTT